MGAHATGMAEIAAARKTVTNFAKLANVWTPPSKNVPKNADPRLGPKTASATTITTTAVVGGIKVTVAATQTIRTNLNTVKTASVWIRTTRTSNPRRRNAWAHANTRIGQATVFAMAVITTVAANMIKAIAVVTQAIKISSNSAK